MVGLLIDCKMWPGGMLYQCAGDIAFWWGSTIPCRRITLDQQRINVDRLIQCWFYVYSTVSAGWVSAKSRHPRDMTEITVKVILNWMTHTHTLVMDTRNSDLTFKFSHIEKKLNCNGNSKILVKHACRCLVFFAYPLFFFNWASPRMFSKVNYNILLKLFHMHACVLIK